MERFIVFEGVKVTFYCFKQLPLNIKQKFEFSCHLIDGERILSVVVGGLTFSVGKPLDFHSTTFQYCLVFLKYNRAVEVLSKVVLHHY